MPCSLTVTRSVLVITPARCISNLRRSFPSTFSVPPMRYKTGRRILPSATGLASGILRPLPISSVMLYRQPVPSVVGIRGAASAVAVDMSSNTTSPARPGRALPKLWNGFDCRSPRRLRNLRPHMSRKYCTSLSILAVVFSLRAVGFPADRLKSERPAPRPEGSRLDQPAGSPSSFHTCALDERVPSSEGAARQRRVRRHIVVVVWDGMRPDFVSEQNTPALWKLSREGVTFRNHHAVYPSATIVNGTALVTGVYPSKNGIIANHVYRPDMDLNHAIDVELPPVVKKGDEVSGGKYISVPTLAQLVQRAGGRTIIATAKTVGLLLDRQIGGSSTAVNASASPLAEGERMKVRGSRSVTLFAGNALPSGALAPITAALGPLPLGHLQHDSWTTKALTDCLWKDGVPTLSILWLGEPDLTQHESAPGAPAALAAIKSADENLAAVLWELDQRKARETTDIFVVSDHGFSTIERSVDLRKIVRDAGFSAKTEFNADHKPGEIMLAGNGGSVLFYVIGHDEKLVRRLVEFLQHSDFAGLCFIIEL